MVKPAVAGRSRPGPAMKRKSGRPRRIVRHPLVDGPTVFCPMKPHGLMVGRWVSTRIGSIAVVFPASTFTVSGVSFPP